MKTNKTSSNKPVFKGKVANFKFELSLKNIFIGAFIGLILINLFVGWREIGKSTSEKPISTVISDIKQKKVDKIEIVGNKVFVTYKDRKVVLTNKESSSSFVTTLKDSGIDMTTLPISVKNTDSTLMSDLISGLIPTILMILFFLFLFRQARSNQESIFSFGQSRGKRFVKENSKVTFADVAGVDEAKKELEEVVDFFKNAKKYTRLGARVPKGVILVGPSGTGKTLLAKAVAGEANVAFFSIAGSEFMEMLVGIGAARVRDLFANAKKAGSAIIFIDEIDAIGRARSSGVMPAHDEREQTLNQILVEMDGFTPTDRVVVMAATNRGDLLDSALLRPGRFDRRVMIDYPDVEGRKAILAIHAKGKPFNESVNWDTVAGRTVGFSGADLENMLNEAAIHAARRDAENIMMDDIEEAATKVKLGPEKKRLQTELDKKITAYHEAGHAIATYFQPNMDPVHRISIVSRGMSLGFTLIPPAKDRLHETKTNLLQRLTAMMGGRAAEELVFSEITTGAANDFDQATRIAKAMVTDWGMSTLGPINFGSSSDITEWGKSYYENSTISPSTATKIDDAIADILKTAYANALELLKKNRKKLDQVATVLLEKESIYGDEFESIVKKS